MAAEYPNTTYVSQSTAPTGVGSRQPIKPTILAFHGSGSNATVHTVQLARLMRVIRPYVEIESLEAPFPSAAGPGVLPFFDGCGPFKRWIPASEKVTTEAMRSGQSTGVMLPEVENLVRSTVRKVRAEGGRVVGLIGFSQGTKVVAGLLKASEMRRALGKAGEGEALDWLDFEFAISVCGSYPPPLLPGCITARLAEAALDSDQRQALLKSKIWTPTFHVQGKQDEWLWAGKCLIDGNYQLGEGQSVVVEWDMGHHYPVPPEENEKIQEWMVGVLRRMEEERAGLW